MAKRTLEVRFTVRTGKPEETMTAVHEFSLDALETNAHTPMADRFSFERIIAVFASRFWTSVVFMGYIDKGGK
jgi:hypothetical protein